MKNISLLLFLFSAMFFFCTASCADSNTQEGTPSATVVFAGSGACLPIIRLLAEEFMRTHPGTDIEVPSSIGSRGGIRACAAGAVSVGLISRNLEANELNLGLTVVPFARTAVVLGVHPSVSEDGITHEDIIDIYKGIKSRWADGQEIIVLTREPRDSAIEAMGRVSPLFMKAYNESHQAKRWTILFTDAQMNSAIMDTPGSIGLTDSGSIVTERLNIKTLTINGVFPTSESVRSGKYPLFKDLSFVFSKERLSGQARAFMEFVHSEDGKGIIEQSGYLLAE
ncbi:MAG: PstS family phosphate ABC transporter substrate-binding protein [Syntrophobacteraceae bacterium]